MRPLLDVRNLMTYFFTAGGLVKAVRGLEFSVDRGETLALVGESGCGKSMTALSLLRLVPPPGKVVEGEILFDGEDLRRIPEAEMRRIRGNQISMIFQEPMTSLNPVFRVGEQIGEVLRLHKGLERRDALEAAVDLLRQVGIPSPEVRVREYPHQLSGGMRQRVMIAMALACDPQLLIADEPTTALDVTIQAQIMELLQRLKEQRRMAILLITHDLGVVAETADRVAIMNAGLIMEYAPVKTIFADPRHPYTRGLLGCIPRLGEKRQRLTPIGGGTAAEPASKRSFLDTCPEPFAPRQSKPPPCRRSRRGTSCAVGDTDMETLLEVRDLRKSFSVAPGPLGGRRRELKAVDGVSFTLRSGETLGLVGESGCGKSTTGRLILRLLEADGGQVLFRGEDVLPMPPRRMRPLRRQMQMIFQDPYASLNPRMRVGDIVGEPLRIHGLAKGAALRSEVLRLLATVGLSEEHYHRYPHEFSGGQRQRIGIARALALKPSLIVADEPVSALDLSIQAQVVNLLQDIQQEFGLTYLFIAHDLSVIEHISDRVAVMYLGRIVELADAEALYRAPRHPYSEALLNAVPVPDPFRTHVRQPLMGEVPSPLAPPEGCHFHPRCPYARDLCRQLEPPLEEKGGGHLAACHFSDETGRFRQR